jgi:hypothetical protein
VREAPCLKDSCRLCLPCGLMVADVVAAYPDGVSSETIAALTGVWRTAVDQTLVNAKRKVKGRIGPIKSRI